MYMHNGRLATCNSSGDHIAEPLNFILILMVHEATRIVWVMYCVVGLYWNSPGIPEGFISHTYPRGYPYNPRVPSSLRADYHERSMQ